MANMRGSDGLIEVGFLGAALTFLAMMGATIAVALGAILVWGFGAAIVVIVCLAFAALGGAIYGSRARSVELEPGGTSYPMEAAAPSASDARAPMPGGLSLIDIFRNLSIDEIRDVSAIGEPLHIAAGETLVKAGFPARHVYAIVSGQAELHGRAPIGDVTVRTAGPGESFPLAAMLGDGAAITSARAMTGMELIAFPTDRLRSLCEENPAVGMKVYAAMAAALGDRYRRTLERLTASLADPLRKVDFWANV